MTNEQWLVYIWSIYPSGGFTIFYTVSLTLFLILLAFSGISYGSDAKTDEKYKNQEYYYYKNFLWYKLGHFKWIIPTILLVLITISSFIPNKNGFMYIVATPYLVEGGKTIIQSLDDNTSKLFKLNKIMDNAIDKALEESEKLKNVDGAKK